MNVVQGLDTVVVTLPLATREPWPGVIPTALAIPGSMFLAMMASLLGWFGWMAPWVLGAAPIASLFVPLIWLVVRSRSEVATLVIDRFVMRVIHRGKAPEFDLSSLRAGVAFDRLSLEQDGDVLELALSPLEGNDVHRLRGVLRDHQSRQSPND